MQNKVACFMAHNVWSTKCYTAGNVTSKIG